MIYSLAIVAAGMRNSHKQLINLRRYITGLWTLRKQHLKAYTHKCTVLPHAWSSSFFHNALRRVGHIEVNHSEGTELGSFTRHGWVFIWAHPTGKNLQIELKWNASALIFWCSDPFHCGVMGGPTVTIRMNHSWANLPYGFMPHQEMNWLKWFLWWNLRTLALPACYFQPCPYKRVQGDNIVIQLCVYIFLTTFLVV